jgi:glycolate oxidase
MPRFNKVTPELVAELKKVVGDKYATTDEEKLLAYQTDEEGNSIYFHTPEVVVFPGSTEEVAAVVKLANKYLVPITPRAAGSGLACGAIPIYNGIVLELDRMDKIIKIDEENMYAIVETGVRTCVIQEEAKRRGLLYAGDPCSSDSCQIGGNVATNAGGNKAVKYGTTRNQIYGMEIVTPTGDIVNVGARIQKCSTGYCLEQLVAGSEGTLGIITKVTLKLRPLPPYKFDLVAIFEDEKKALALPNKILKAGIEPTSIEFMDNRCLVICTNFVKETLPHVDKGASYVIITVETFDEDELDKKMEQMSDICDEAGAVDVLQADDRVWAARRSLGEAARDFDMGFVAEDFVVPLDKIAEITAMLPALEEKHHLYTMTGAHIGDGNVHTTLLNSEKVSPEEWFAKVKKFHQEFFPIVYSMGGKMSGEHGIGFKKMADFNRVTQPGELKMIKAIKQALDPNNIMNPSKIVDLEVE